MNLSRAPPSGEGTSEGHQKLRSSSMDLKTIAGNRLALTGSTWGSTACVTRRYWQAIPTRLGTGWRASQRLQRITSAASKLSPRICQQQ